MSDKRDYYEVLGVQRDAGANDIRRAYKKAAVKYHPDRNQGDAEAEAKFKEATEAYSVLSDEQKKQVYDRFGHQGLQGGAPDFSNVGMGDILSQFQDLFSDFFGGFGGGGPFPGGGRRRQSRGQDVGVDTALTLKEAMTGTKKEVTFRGVAPCDVCEGSGAKEGSTPEVCGSCGGQGQVATQRGFIMFSTTCPTCGGRGQTIKDPCDRCSGRGAVEKERRVLVTFPAGIDAGQRLRVPGQGMPGPGESAAGDLYVDVHLEPDDRFDREGADLITQAPLTFAEAALGGEVEIELPDETEVTVKVEAGTQPGSVLTVRGEGMPRLDRRGGRGDLHVVADVIVPKKLSKKAKKLLQELDAELGD